MYATRGELLLGLHCTERAHFSVYFLIEFRPMFIIYVVWVR